MVLEVLEPIYTHALASELHLRQQRLLVAREPRHALPRFGLTREVDQLEGHTLVAKEVEHPLAVLRDLAISSRRTYKHADGQPAAAVTVVREAAICCSLV